MSRTSETFSVPNPLKEAVRQLYIEQKHLDTCTRRFGEAMAKAYVEGSEKPMRQVAKEAGYEELKKQELAVEAAKVNLLATVMTWGDELL
jgi:hypothetical protein